MWGRQNSIKNEKEIRAYFDFDQLSISKGIPHLLNESSKTFLDQMNYDAVYEVDYTSAITEYNNIAEQITPILNQSMSSVLEIGAGTGMFTLGFIEKASFDQYVVSDVSIKMLKQLQKKIEHQVKSGKISKETLNKLIFLGLDCEQFKSKENVFDLIIARSMLHHILSYEVLLKELASSLKMNGVAYFMEPNLAYYSFIVHFVGWILRSKSIVDKYSTSQDYLKLRSWRASIFPRVKYRKDKNYLKNLEDKHIFDKTELEAQFKKAGFSHVEFISRYPSSKLSDRIESTMRELQIVDQNFKKSIMRELQFFDHDLEKLLIRDALNPAYHIVASHRSLVIQQRNQGKKYDSNKCDLVKETKLKIMFDKISSGHIAGWAVAIKEIYRIIVRQREDELVLLLTQPRPDVHQNFQGADYPEDVIFYSGFEVEDDIRIDLEKAKIFVEFRDGNQLETTYSQVM